MSGWWNCPKFVIVHKLNDVYELIIHYIRSLYTFTLENMYLKAFFVVVENGITVFQKQIKPRWISTKAIFPFSLSRTLNVIHPVIYFKACKASYSCQQFAVL